MLDVPSDWTCVMWLNRWPSGSSLVCITCEWWLCTDVHGKGLSMEKWWHSQFTFSHRLGNTSWMFYESCQIFHFNMWMYNYSYPELYMGRGSYWLNCLGLILFWIWVWHFSWTTLHEIFSTFVFVFFSTNDLFFCLAFLFCTCHCQNFLGESFIPSVLHKYLLDIPLPI